MHASRAIRLALTFAWLLLPGRTVSAQGGPAAHHVLVLDNGDPLRPWYEQRARSFQRRLRELVNGPVTISQEQLALTPRDARLLADPALSWIRQKYVHHPVDLVVMSDDYAAPVRRWFGDSLPIMFLAAGAWANRFPLLTTPIPNATGVVEGNVIEAMRRDMLRVLPELETVAVVSYDEATARDVGRLLTAGSGKRIRTVIPIVRPRLAELPQQIAALPQTAAVFFYAMEQDGDGRLWIPADFLASFAPTSVRPVFSVGRSVMGRGIVGGPLSDPARMGELLAERSAAILKGARASDLPVIRYEQWEWSYDWQQLDRFGIPASRLSPAATVVNRPPSIWEQHPVPIALGFALVAVLCATLLYVLHNARRLHLARLRQRQLTRRIMEVQEQERNRIACDLHDDLCQQLSLLAIDLDQARIPNDRTRPGDRVRQIIARTQSIARDLHSSRIIERDLPRELEQLADDLARRTGITVTMQVRDWPQGIPPQHAVAIYRIAQEALNNVVRHASAATCTIRMCGASANGWEVAIEDDGVGLQLSRSLKSNGGLGLLSMTERARAIGARFRAQSRDLSGTVVQVIWPSVAA